MLTTLGIRRRRRRAKLGIGMPGDNSHILAVARRLRDVAETKMKTNARKIESFDELDKLAPDTSKIRPLSPRLRRESEAALGTGTRNGPGRRRKTAKPQSRIVPVSIDSELLDAVDRYASSAGVTRSQLVAEALKLRISR